MTHVTKVGSSLAAFCKMKADITAVHTLTHAPDAPVSLTLCTARPSCRSSYHCVHTIYPFNTCLRLFTPPRMSLLLRTVRPASPG
jgi:hypothetical protein